MLIPYLGSDKSAACLTRPQYVSRLYCEAGNARLPGSEADILYVYDDGTRQAQKKLWWPTVAGGLVEKICLLVRPLQAAFWSKSKRLLFDRPMFADPFRCFMTLGHGEILRKKIHVHFV